MNKFIELPRIVKNPKIEVTVISSDMKYKKLQIKISNRYYVYLSECSRFWRYGFFEYIFKIATGNEDIINPMKKLIEDDMRQINYITIDVFNDKITNFKVVFGKDSDDENEKNIAVFDTCVSPKYNSNVIFEHFMRRVNEEV